MPGRQSRGKGCSRMSESSDPPNSGSYPGAGDPWSTPGSTPDSGQTPGQSYPTPGAANPWGQPRPDPGAGAFPQWQPGAAPPPTSPADQPNQWGVSVPTPQPPS